MTKVQCTFAGTRLNGAADNIDYEALAKLKGSGLTQYVRLKGGAPVRAPIAPPSFEPFRTWPASAVDVESDEEDDGEESEESDDESDEESDDESDEEPDEEPVEEEPEPVDWLTFLEVPQAVPSTRRHQGIRQ